MVESELTFLGVSAGDWLQAAATFFGVGATIVGTLFIERKMRSHDDEEDQRRILEVVTHIKDAAAAIRAGLPDDPTNFEHYARSLTRQTTLKSAIDMYRFVRADTKIKNLKLWRALRSLDDILANHGATVETELRVFTADGHHTAVFNINRAKVMAASVPIDTASQDVLTALG